MWHHFVGEAKIPDVCCALISLLSLHWYAIPLSGIACRHAHHWCHLDISGIACTLLCGCQLVAGFMPRVVGCKCSHFANIRACSQARGHVSSS
jgi:hypothetical protein